jgi:pyroglutamyl-peptidase
MSSTRGCICAVSVFVLVSSQVAGVSVVHYHDDAIVGEVPVVLVTGFEPFNAFTVNPSQLIAESLNGEHIEGAVVVGIVLPVDFTTSIDIIMAAITEYDPVLVISIGLENRSSVIHVEKYGWNLKRETTSWQIPHVLHPGGPLIEAASLDERLIVSAIRNVGIPATQSCFPGMYVCNAVLYETLDFIKEHNYSTIAGFMHIPNLVYQNPDGLELDVMISAVSIAIECSI